VESASGKQDPIDLRIYPGTNADFTLYEDEGDSYDYEHGAYSVIPLHWDENSQTLTIGDRRGSFPKMLEHRTFRVVIVRDGHGTGIASSSAPDTTVEYEGTAISRHLELLK
jgi:alpha-D-xyloside xylohydrolase